MKKKAGGGYKHGAAAQEESLFRRSNYNEFLDVIHPPGLYPIPEFGGIYSQNVLVFRASEKKGYQFLLQPIFLNFIAAAAYNDPLNDEFYKDRYVADTEQKIRSILKIGLNHGHDAIVLGAFGCGAFKNPPKHIALLFQKVLREFDGYYKTVVFAILEDKNSMNNSAQGNLDTFLSVFKDQYSK